MTHPLTVASVTDDGWTAITDDGVRVTIPASASQARLRVGQRVWAERAGECIARVWVGPSGVPIRPADSHGVT